MSQLNLLRQAKSLDDLAKLLNFKPKFISYLLFKQNEKDRYAEFEISKQSGGKRKISAPNPKLLRLQKNLADLLAGCLVEMENSGERKTPFVHGFVKHKSIFTNAKSHRNKRWVLNVDLEDFFGSINFGRVRGLLIKDKAFALDPTVATLIAQIASHKNSLPQGAPTSPIISNLVARPLDLKLVGLAKKYGCNYTRFADDITFSTNKKDFPAQLVINPGADEHQWELSIELRNSLTKSGFAENTKKTRLQYYKSRQEVTGLIVNDRINVPREYRKSVRALVHSLVTKGSFELPKNFQNRINNKRVRNVNPLHQLQGMLGYIDWIDIRSDINARNLSTEDVKHKKTKSHKSRELGSQEKQYKKFLLYREFFAAEKLTILTEGKTDKYHLFSAAIKLSKEFPLLADAASTPKKVLFRVFPSKERRTNALLGLCGGVADLASFLSEYKRETLHFRPPDISHPVIVLVDKDSGWKKIAKVIPGSPDGSDDFYRIHANLYVVCIPPPPGKDEGCIEDLHATATLGTILNGKSFDKKNKSKDEGAHYGKSAFAQQVVVPNADKLDFDGFKPLLRKLVEVIKGHENIESITE